MLMQQSGSKYAPILIFFSLGVILFSFGLFQNTFGVFKTLRSLIYDAEEICV